MQYFAPMFLHLSTLFEINDEMGQTPTKYPHELDAFGFRNIVVPHVCQWCGAGVLEVCDIKIFWYKRTNFNSSAEVHAWRLPLFPGTTTRMSREPEINVRRVAGNPLVPGNLPLVGISARTILVALQYTPMFPTPLVQNPYKGIFPRSHPRPH